MNLYAGELEKLEAREDIRMVNNMALALGRLEESSAVRMKNRILKIAGVTNSRKMPNPMAMAAAGIRVVPASHRKAPVRPKD